MKSIKKFGGLLLTLVLVMSMLSIVAFAEAPAGFTELDLEWEMGYYTSQSGRKPLTESAKAFASTQQFTKEDLPNGTKIVFTNISTEDSKYWRYSIATWVISENDGETLVDNTTADVWKTEAITITVDDAWWGENTTCAFSVHERGVYSQLTDRTDDLSRAFKIYVPSGDGSGSDTGSDTEHTHAHGTEWKKDANNHWNECACGDKANKAAHADANVDGKCDVCAYEVAADNDNPQTGDNSMITLWVTLLCVSACGFVVIMMSRKKSAF